MSRVIGADEIRELVPMPDAVAAVREAFLALHAGEFELPVRTALGDGSFLAMSAHHLASRSAIVKSISIDFDRRPAVAGSVTWMRLGTAETVILDAPTVTSLRTGAVSGVATDLLAPPDASTLVLIGLGGQAPDQLRGVRAVRDIRRVVLVDRSPDLADAFVARCGDALDGLEVQVGTDARAAVGDADIICSATPSTDPLFALDDLPPRVHVNAIGAFRPSMRELPDELLGDALVVVDEVAAALEESGEIRHAMAAGMLLVEDLVELGAALAAPAPQAQRTVFKSVGLAVQDWAVAAAVARRLDG